MVAVDMMNLSSNKIASQDTFGPNGATDTIMAAVAEGDFASVLNASLSSGIWLGMPTLTTRRWISSYGLETTQCCRTCPISHLL